MRERIVNIIVILIFIILALSLAKLGVIYGGKYRQLSYKNYIRLLPQTGARGKILDRNGNLIVGNKLCYDVMISPSIPAEELAATLQSVSRILGIEVKELRIRLERAYIGPFAPIIVASTIDTKKAIALEELKPELSSITVQPRASRDYPYGSLACQVLGYLNEIDRWRLTKLADYGYKTKDIVGFGGVEEKYDYYLRQEEGGLSVVVDHLNRLVRVLGFKPPRNGRDIRLTLDLKIQKIVEANLQGRTGSVIFMDPYNGEIIAMASYPNFQPSWFVEKSEKLAGIFSDSDAPLINRAISGVYPAGSAFKMVIATAALQTRKINPSTTFVCTGVKHVGRAIFACWNTHGPQDLLNAIAHSCNVYFYSTGLLLGGQIIHDYALKFGFSKPTSIDLPYESYGFVPSPLWKKIYRFQKWTDGDTANFSIGQGDLLITPIQLTRMIAVFANKGFLVTPYIIKSVGTKDISVSQRKASAFPANERVIETVRQGLRAVVTDLHGTGSILSLLPVTSAGKTGTVQVPKGQPHAWFVGFVPFEKPRYAFCVFLEHGGSGWASCALAKKILEAMTKEGLL